MFEPTGSGAIAGLLDALNARLAQLGGTALVAPIATGGAVPPDVMFGCDRRGSLECEIDDRTLGKAPAMRLAVGRPSPQWIAGLGDVLEASGGDHVLLITLEIGEYWPTQSNWYGSKEVRLGTGHAQKVPWLTSVDQPVQVIQLTGALVDREGRALKIGAEGMLAKRTNLVMSGFGVTALITDEDVEQLQGLRRHDLAGSPLIWEVALTNLVRQLTGDGILR